ncbi:MAG: glycosyltransferase [bacterium]|nr:glycosyltransferase [bacterium]
MQLAIVIVHYHTPRLVAAALKALEDDLARSGLEAELLLVDNGSRPEDRGLFAELPVRRLDPGRNLGYAGGVNLGVRESTAERVVVMNPDALVLPGCLGALSEALGEGAAAAGPRFYWDREKRWLLPPTEIRSRRAELEALAARRGGRWAARGRRRWRRHARRHWLAHQRFSSYELSGALLAFRRSAWQRVGPFDERYRLYFEETDWLERLRAAGLQACCVPQAEVVHLYAQSTMREPQADGWFLESNRRFRRRFYGPAFTTALELVSRLLTARAPRGVAAWDERTPEGAAVDGAWLELSAAAAGYPAAARPPGPGTISASPLPEEIRRRLQPGTYHLRWVDPEGRELAVRTLQIPTL